jgi:hypothetical protein
VTVGGINQASLRGIGVAQSGPLAISPNPVTLPPITRGTPYSVVFTTFGGTPAYTYTVAIGNLAQFGLSLASNGTLSGTTPTTVTPGTYAFVMQVQDSATPRNNISVSYYPLVIN